MAFDVNKHLTQLKGKDYLEVRWRLAWFRDEHETDWGIETEPIIIDDSKAIYKATIRDGNGKIIAQGTKMETPKGFPDYVEKAETGAIGRALAAAGYGTQFAPELEEGERIVDSPVDRPGPVASLKVLFDEAAAHGIGPAVLTPSLLASKKLNIKKVEDLKPAQISALLASLREDPEKFKTNLVKAS